MAKQAQNFMQSALDLVQAVQQNEMAPQAAVEMCLGAIEAHEPIVKAFCCLDPAMALEAAMHSTGPLKGICVAIKDVFDTADMPTEYNSPIYRGYQPRADASLVSIIRGLGASIIGKSVTTEFAFFSPGPTTNPNNPDYSPGGSSSGSAAAVAAGMVPLAIGTQTGGSVIRPAAFCGITGYKPSFGFLPKSGLKNLSPSLDTAGLFAPHVRDVAFFAALLTGRSLRVDGGVQGAPKIGLIKTHHWVDVDHDMQEGLEIAARLATRSGATVIEMNFDDIIMRAFSSHQIIHDYEASRALAWEHREHPDKLSTLITETLEFGKTIPNADYDEALAQAAEARKIIADQLSSVDVFLTPSAPGIAPKGLASTGSSLFNRVWTLLHLPCVNVPGLRGSNDMPIGMQIVGPYLEDRKTLAAADWLENVLRKSLS